MLLWHTGTLKGGFNMKKKLSAYLAIAMIIMNISISAVCADGTVITEIGYNGLRNTALVDSSAHTIDCYI